MILANGGNIPAILFVVEHGGVDHVVAAQHLSLQFEQVFRIADVRTNSRWHSAYRLKEGGEDPHVYKQVVLHCLI
jgi:hypothetical protein